MSDPHEADFVAENRDLREYLAELENYLDVVAAERNAADNIASKMATAIGWNTPGENWVEKAAALRGVKEQLAEAVRLLWIDHGGVQPGCNVCAFLAEHPDPTTEARQP